MKMFEGIISQDVGVMEVTTGFRNVNEANIVVKYPMWYQELVLL